MFRPFATFVGLRYARPGRQQGFVSLVSLLSLGGMVVGVCALILVQSVMNGFELRILDRFLAVIPDAWVVTADADETIDDWRRWADMLEQRPEVRVVAPEIGGPGLIAASGRLTGIKVNGLLPEREMRTTRLAQNLTDGRLDALQPGSWSVILGRGVARTLGGVGVGDRVQLLLPDPQPNPAGLFPRIRSFEVVGIFSVGSLPDESEVYIHLDDAARLYRLPPGQSHRLRLALSDFNQAPEIAARLGEELPPSLVVHDFSHYQPSLFRALRLEKRVVTLLLFIVVAVASFNIVSILSVMVGAKRTDIGVLRALGSSRRAVMGVFLSQGMAVGGIGILVGLALGLLLTVAMGGLHQNLGGLGSMIGLPVRLETGDLALTMLGAWLLVLLATLYPARRAGRVEPAVALRRR